MSYYDGLDASKQILIDQHLKLVIEANKRINLTRIDDFEEARVLHIEDSLSGLPEMNASPEGLYADIGSGAGFPGIPLAIATGRKTVLVDARLKKMQVVREMIEQIGLQNQIEVFPGRAELLARKQRNRYSVITARALARLSVLLELSMPLLRTGGHLICFKSSVEEQEVSEAASIEDLIGMKLVREREFLLSNGHRRTIFTYEKTGLSKIKLPRQEGMAQKNPLHRKANIV